MNLRSWIFTARWDYVRSSPEGSHDGHGIKNGYKVALVSHRAQLIARIMEETGMRPVFDLIKSAAASLSRASPIRRSIIIRQDPGDPGRGVLVVEDSTWDPGGKAAGMTVAALEDDRFGLDQSQRISRSGRSEILKFLPGTEI